MIGKIMQELRKNKKMTTADVAEAVGIKPRTYLSYETEEREPNITIINALADFYGVSTDYLLGRDPNPLSNIRLDIIGTDDEAFSAAYKNLPDYAKLIFMDALKKLAEAGAKGREGMTISTECGAIEDAAKEKDDISAG